MYTKYKIVPFCPYHFVQYRLLPALAKAGGSRRW